MRRIRFGRTEQQVPAVSVGTWSHGGAKGGGKQSVGWSGHDDGKATDALTRAWELGLSHWDTADAYGDGQAEELIGRMWDRVPRQDIFLATKVGWLPGAFGHHYHPDQIRAQLDRSLAHLRTDHVDLYYLHRCEFGRDDAYFEPAVETLQEARSKGKVRFLGLSDWESPKVLRYARRMDPDVVQIYRNLIDDEYERSGLEAWVGERDAGVAFFSPLRHGLLLGKYDRPVDFGDGDFRSGIDAFRDADELRRLRHARAEVEARFGTHPEPILHALLGSILSDVTSGCALLGLRNREQAEAAGRVGETLGEADLAWLRELYRPPESPPGV